MKKIISLIAIFIFVLIMSGCRDKEQEKITCNDIGGEWIERWDTRDYCLEPTYLFYTQEEVDLIIQEIEDSFDYQAMNNLNERVYYLENELRDFERFEYEDLLEFEEAFDDWEDELGAYILSLEARIEALENPGGE